MILLNKYINPSLGGSYALNIRHTLYLILDDHAPAYDMALCIKLSPKILLGYNFQMIEKKIYVSSFIEIEFTYRHTNSLEIYNKQKREMYTVCLERICEADILPVVEYYRNIKELKEYDPDHWNAYNTCNMEF